MVCFPDNYEVAFDILSNYVAAGLKLSEATLNDGGSFLNLPVRSFDGQSISPHLQNLQKEWEDVLAIKPEQRQAEKNSQFKEWDRQLITYYEKQIARVYRNLACNTKAMTKVNQRRASGLGLEHYESMQRKYLQLLNRYQTCYKKALVHLEHLERHQSLT
ncbi:hypothetical protein GCM10028803_07650 [Larkinella knui]